MPALKSPITVETARRLTAYSSKVFVRYVRDARKLPQRVAMADKGTGHLSIFRTLVHILNVHEVWMVYIVQGRGGELRELFLQTARKPTSWEGFDTYAAKVWTDVEHYVGTLTPSKLARRVKAPWMPGQYTVGDAVLQSTFEQAHHLGEIIGVYWQRDQAPPEMTWIDVNRGRAR